MGNTLSPEHRAAISSSMKAFHHAQYLARPTAGATFALKPGASRINAQPAPIPGAPETPDV